MLRVGFLPKGNNTLARPPVCNEISFSRLRGTLSPLLRNDAYVMTKEEVKVNRRLRVGRLIRLSMPSSTWKGFIPWLLRH